MVHWQRESRWERALSVGETAMPTRRNGLALAALLVMALAGPAHAQPREDGAPAESMGAGDAVRASVWGPAALFHNPAGLMRVPVIVLQGGYSYLDGQEGHTATAAMVDSRTNEYAALGVAYSFISSAPDGRDRDGNQVRTALATGYRSGDFALYAGIGLRWLELTLGEEDPGGDESDDVDTWTLDTGLLFDFANRIRFAIVGQNLIDTETDQAPRLLGFGFSFVFETLDVGANLDLDISGRDGGSRVMRWGFGADWGLAEQIHLRTGLTRDELLDQERVSFGLGWSTNEIAIDLAYVTAFVEPTNMMFGVSLRWVP